MKVLTESGLLRLQFLAKNVSAFLVKFIEYSLYAFFFISYSRLKISLEKDGLRLWAMRGGCNPPSVLMRHSANAPSILNNSACFIGTCWVDVSFLLRSQGSRLTPLRTLQFYTWGGVSSSLTKRLESHTPTRQPKYNSVMDSNKNFGNLILLHVYLWCRWMSHV